MPDAGGPCQPRQARMEAGITDIDDKGNPAADERELARESLVCKLGE